MDKLSPIERMGTEVLGVRYDVARPTGQLHMLDGYRCDMQVCIDLFEVSIHVSRLSSRMQAPGQTRSTAATTAGGLPSRRKTSGQLTASRPVSAKSKT
jgi:hypothetical protein